MNWKFLYKYRLHLDQLYHSQREVVVIGASITTTGLSAISTEDFEIDIELNSDFYIVIMPTFRDLGDMSRNLIVLTTTGNWMKCLIELRII